MVAPTAKPSYHFSGRRRHYYILSPFGTSSPTIREEQAPPLPVITSYHFAGRRGAVPYGEAILSLLTHHSSLFLAFPSGGRGTTLVVDEVFLNTNKYSTDDQWSPLRRSHLITYHSSLLTFKAPTAKPSYHFSLITPHFSLPPKGRALN